ncbi:MAG TPA: hypothetical protein VI356_22355 [Myxococcales bacterium]
MKCIGRIAALAAALGLSATPVFAAETSPASAGPAKLSDGQLDEVTGGDGSLLNLPLNLNLTLQNISIAVNVSNVPINAAVAVQANALGQAIQSATVLAGQTVTQGQMFQ